MYITIHIYEWVKYLDKKFKNETVNKRNRYDLKVFLMFEMIGVSIRDYDNENVYFGSKSIRVNEV